MHFVDIFDEKFYHPYTNPEIDMVYFCNQDNHFNEYYCWCVIRLQATYIRGFQMH